MLRRLWMIAWGWLVLSGAVAGALPASAAAVPGLPTWLVGCWARDEGGDVYTERWVRADDATLLGLSFGRRDGVLREFEFLRITADAAGVTYHALPNGGPEETVFVAAAAASGEEVVFANPAHDYPKRVGYRRSGDSLLAWIDDGTDAREARREFPMQRAACEP